jgi:hypothetical protein
MHELSNQQLLIDILLWNKKASIEALEGVQHITTYERIGMEALEEVTAHYATIY